MRVVLLDKKTGININWGCTQRAMSRQPGNHYNFSSYSCSGHVVSKLGTSILSAPSEWFLLFEISAYDKQRHYTVSMSTSDNY